jgi:hypothetical protein
MGVHWKCINVDDTDANDRVEIPFDEKMPDSLKNMEINQEVTLEIAYTPRGMTSWKNCVFYIPITHSFNIMSNIMSKKRWICIPKEEKTYICMESMITDTNIEVCRCKLLPNPKILKTKKNFGMLYMIDFVFRQFNAQNTTDLIENLSAFFMSHYLKMLPSKAFDPNLDDKDIRIPSDLKNGPLIPVYQFLINNRNTVFNESSKHLQKRVTNFVSKYFQSHTSFYFGLRYFPIIVQPSVVNALFVSLSGIQKSVLPTTGPFLRVKPYTQKDKLEFTNINYENQANARSFIIMACKHLNETFDLHVESENYLNYIEDFYEWNTFLQTYILSINPKTLKRTMEKLYNLMHVPIRSHEMSVVSKQLPLHKIENKDSSIHFIKVSVTQKDTGEFREGFVKRPHANTTATDSLRRALVLHETNQFNFFDYQHHKSLLKKKNGEDTANMFIEYWTTPNHADNTTTNCWFRNLYRNTWYKFDEIQLKYDLPDKTTSTSIFDTASDVVYDFTDYQDYTVIRFNNKSSVFEMMMLMTSSPMNKTCVLMHLKANNITIEQNSLNIHFNDKLFITHPTKILIQVLHNDPGLLERMGMSPDTPDTPDPTKPFRWFKTFKPFVNLTKQKDEDVHLIQMNQFNKLDSTVDVFFRKEVGFNDYEFHDLPEKIDQKRVTVYKDNLFRRNSWLYGLLRLLDHQSFRILTISRWNGAVAVASMLKIPGDGINMSLGMFTYGYHAYTKGPFVCTTLEGDVVDCKNAIGKSEHVVTISLEQMNITSHDPLPKVHFNYLTDFEGQNPVHLQTKEAFNFLSNTMQDTWFAFLALLGTANRIRKNPETLYEFVQYLRHVAYVSHNNVLLFSKIFFAFGNLLFFTKGLWIPFFASLYWVQFILGILLLSGVKSARSKH